jgi:2-hydroxychromene-2-carboxylate isomerase
MSRPTIHWFFDFLSPYSYLQLLRMPEIEALADVTRVPVLFAGLLSHWGTKGPAEVPAKRMFTFQHVAWLAHERGVTMRTPSPFPFNPLPLLRLAIAQHSAAAAVARIFDWVWREGHTPADAVALDALLQEFDADRAKLDDAGVKAQLRANTEAAIGAGVFGVPTAIVDGRLFWGQDATDMLLAHLRGDPFFDSAAYRAAAELAPGVQRRS